MSELVGRILHNLFELKGTHVFESAQELQAILEDLCPDEHKAIHLILVGLAENIPFQLLDNPAMSLSLQKTLAKQLQVKLQLHSLLAKWITETWSCVLNLRPFALAPSNIFYEAANEYRQAFGAVLSTGQVTELLKSELNQLAQQLLLSEAEVSLIHQEIKDDIEQHQAIQNRPQLSHLLLEPIRNELDMAFVRVEAGQFLMGSPRYEPQREPDEIQHSVQITQTFVIQTTPVTQAQWQAVLGDRPADFKGALLPVENVSWNDIVTRFLPKLNEMGMGSYRLPTEAEWEYAARAGNWQAYTQSDHPNHLTQYAWFTQNSDFQTHPVASKAANAWGLYDMNGNVWEWCQDWYAPFESAALNDPQGPKKGAGRVMRGGSWFCNAGACRLASRGYMPPETRIRLIGFRLVKVLDQAFQKRAE